MVKLVFFDKMRLLLFSLLIANGPFWRHGLSSLGHVPMTVRLAMCRAERERERFVGLSSVGITLELPVHVLLVLLLLVTSLLRLQALIPGVKPQPHRHFFPGLPSGVSSSPAVVVTKSSGLHSCRPLHSPVDASSSFVFAEPEAYRREGKSGGCIAMS